MSEDVKLFAKPAGGHVSLGSTLRGVLFVMPTAIVAWIFYPLAIRGTVPQPPVIGAFLVAAFLWFVAVSGLRVAAQWERGVVLRLGKFRCANGRGARVL